MTEERSCPTCGASLPPDAATCPRCRTDLSASPPPPGQRDYTVLIGILIATVFLVGVAFAAFIALREH